MGEGHSLNIERKFSGSVRLMQAAWTLLLLLLFGVHCWQEYEDTYEFALISARESIRKDLSYRKWNAGHGGVYVPVTSTTTPNPHLDDNPLRDLEAREGIRLTLVNPAYMTRQVHEQDGKQYGIRGHITSLRPLRPENAPDGWERQALVRFEAGEQEVHAKVRQDGTDYLRVMVPFRVEERCLSCHAKQGYKVGDIRGGISASIPLTFYRDREIKDVRTAIIAYTLLWCAGFFGIKWFRRHIVARIRESEAAQEELKLSEKRYRQLFEQMSEGFALHRIVLDDAGKPIDYLFLEVNPEFERLTGLIAADVVGKRVLEILPQTEPFWIETYGRVATGGEPVRFRHYSVELQRWFEVSAYSPEPGIFAALFTDTSELMRIMQRLREYEYIVENSHDMIVSYDTDLVFQLANAAYLKARGFDREKVVGRPAAEVLDPQVYEKLVRPNLEMAFRGHSVEFRLEYPREADEPQQMLVKYEPMHQEDGSVSRVFGFITDETDRFRLEEQLRQVQRLESIGTLAGGVAHDFNNILTVIMGACALLQLELAGNRELEPLLRQISESSERAAKLTHSLLAFSRKQAIQTSRQDLNVVLMAMQDFLARLIGEDVTLEFTPSPELIVADIDRGQIEQVIMNLVVNARDAVAQGGGTIQMGLSRFVHKGQCAALEGCREGEYAVLTVSDTGCGMDEDIMNRIFEPFFSTKEVGRGTGLGLSMAYGIVRQHGGAIGVASQPGRGTVFSIYLPLTGRESSTAGTAENLDLPGGNETILLVEDDVQVLATNRTMLEKAGYRILAASGGDEALAIIDSHAHEIQLAVLDVVMPGISGRQLHDVIKERCPQAAVLFVSGYTAQMLDERGVVPGRFNLLHKPLNLYTLLKRVRELLDAGRHDDGI